MKTVLLVVVKTSAARLESSAGILEAGSTNYGPLDVDQCVVFPDSGSACHPRVLFGGDDSLIALNKSPPTHTHTLFSLHPRERVGQRERE